MKIKNSNNKSNKIVSKRQQSQKTNTNKKLYTVCALPTHMRLITSLTIASVIAITIRRYATLGSYRRGANRDTTR